MLSKLEQKQRQKESFAKWKTKNPERYKESLSKAKQKRVSTGMNAVYQRRYREKYPEKYRALCKGNYSYKNHLSYMYKLDIKDYEKMREQQENKCAICGENPKNKLFLDHNHVTGKNRELLCVFCNTSLGLIKENINTLVNMVRYINKHDISEELIETK